MLIIHIFIFLLIILLDVCRWSSTLKPVYRIFDSSWMSLNKWKSNGDKTELLIIGSQFRRTLQFPLAVLDDGSVNRPYKYARNIGVTFDIVLNIKRHTTDICKSCYFNIRNIYRIRKFLSTELTKILVNAFVTSRLNNCISILYGLPRYVLHKLQLIQNCAARLILGGYEYDYITPHSESFICLYCF